MTADNDHSPSDARPWVASYAADVPAEVEVPDGSLAHLIDDSVRAYGRHVALEFFGATTTYAELGDQIARAAEGLRKLGVSKGDRVALVLPNCPQHVAAFYAVLRLGAVVVEHNPLYTPRELRHQFEDHGATVAIVWDKVAATVQDLPADLGVTTVVSVDLTRAMPASKRFALSLPVPAARTTREQLTAKVSGTIRWDSLVTSRRLKASSPRPERDDLALIQYTSGTTGRPKGAMLTHGNLTVNAAQARAWVPTIERGTSVVYAVLPLFHAYGLTLCLTFAMSMGARLVLFPKFDPDLVLDVVKKRPATFLPAVPPIYERLVQAAEKRKVSLSGIQIAISGAMSLPQGIVDLWEGETGGYLVEGYGLSECSPVLMANPVGATRKPGTVGLPLPSTELRVADPEDPSVDRPFGEEGELLARGPQVFSGYWRKPDESSSVFTDDGWFRTGDIVTMDEDGFVRIVDRIKELIVTGGFNVSPTEVEEALRSFPGVADVAVVGLPHRRGGEDVVAAVVMEAGASFDEEAIRAYGRDCLTPYKVPKHVVQVDELPRSIVGKVIRRKVRDQLLAAQGA
ncbi:MULTISPECIES: long-chain-fatty-acid--CoA ligase [unclassified Leifsonia]|uniref:long-chain-fatty-acid--CoA ligase n=1 Tax=unclassified Leifsonia TaxID=2663824 RepID=UPI0008A76A96|nr:MULTISPECIES: long-chain-fatty-acid--CoA ligase [unclassified Leifsonia]SEI09039.1 long-chain acyl-CoA synthetase [Leifsonia sp. CL154]SFL84065.1 long-chain acyl-CoA synthetase [Leifsonia sp. CL147]